MLREMTVINFKKWEMCMFKTVMKFLALYLTLFQLQDSMLLHHRH